MAARLFKLTCNATSFIERRRTAFATSVSRALNSGVVLEPRDSGLVAIFVVEVACSAVRSEAAAETTRTQ